MFVAPFLADLRRSSRGDTSAALVSNEAVLIANARPAKVITKTNKNNYHPNNLKFQTKSPGYENLGTVRSPPLQHFPCRQAGGPAKLSQEASPSHRYWTMLVITKKLKHLLKAMADGGDSVYGLYGDLLNVRDYDCDSTELGRTCQEIHRSDPELDTIPYRVSTLDRRVTMKSQRPRSLDLSSWSVESRGSCHTTSSSDTSSEYASPSVSRNASFISNRSSFIGSIGPASIVEAPAPVGTGGVVTNNGTGLRRRPSCRQPVRSSSKLNDGSPGQRTVTTLMGGRGYIQWRKGVVQAGVNNSDAYLVIWDHRL